MQVKAFQIYSPGVDLPTRLEMIADGVDLHARAAYNHNGWRIYYHGTETVTFSSESERHRVDATELGMRTGMDLCHLYESDSPAWEAFESCDDWLRRKPEPSGDMVAYEGRFNTSGAVSRAVYPVTVFSEFNETVIPRELFMPVTALNELIQSYESYPYKLVPALAPAVVGDLVFELSHTSHGQKFSDVSSDSFAQLMSLNPHDSWRY